MLRMLYSGPRKTNTSDRVNRRSLPAMLQRESNLYQFITHLFRRQRFWAAANVMITCFRLANFHCAALWASTREFLSSDPGHGDEPTACFGLVLLQIFMEGMLSVGLDAIPNKLNLWNELQRQHNNLRALLRNSLGEDTWVNSRGYWRGRLIDFDKVTSDAGPQIHRGPPELLQQVQTHAEEHGDRYLADSVRWRLDVILHGTDVAATRYLDGALLLPIGAYSKRYNITIVQDQPSQQRHSAPLQATSQANAAMRSSGPSGSSQTQTHTLQSQPPWQHSEALGGKFWYKPSTETIVLQGGQRFSRPAHIPRASLGKAAWEGPLPRPTGSTRSDASSHQHPALSRGGRAPASPSDTRHRGTGVGKHGSGSESDAGNDTDGEDEEDDDVEGDEEADEDEGDVEYASFVRGSRQTADALG